MSNDPADAAAKALVFYWRREEMDAAQRHHCSRLAQVLEPSVRSELSKLAREEAEGSVPRVAMALRDAMGADGWVTALVRASLPRGALDTPRINVDVRGKGNHTVVAGGDIISGVPSDRKGTSAPSPSPEVILVAAAEPVDLDILRLGEEAREIEEAIQLGRERDRWVVQPRSAVRLRDLSRALIQSTPRVVHFSGHGNREGIFLEDATGSAHHLPPEALDALFAALPREVECVVLNACFSEPQARAISAHVSYVIGTKGELPDRAAIGFSVGFYQALGAGLTVRQAYGLGRAHWYGEEVAGYPPPTLIERGNPA
jgi:hypothetical protein